ncbi:MAG: hypothetical protein JJU33_09635 [Phycisphaerales bacterium]|nr:hypothetical protein [Phycisphaerales bacterium]
MDNKRRRKVLAGWLERALVCGAVVLGAGLLASCGSEPEGGEAARGELAAAAMGGASDGADRGNAGGKVALDQTDMLSPAWVSLLQSEGVLLRCGASRTLAFQAAVRNTASVAWAGRQLDSNDPGTFRLAADMLASHREDAAAVQAAMLDIVRDDERPERIRTFALITAGGFAQLEAFIAHEPLDAYARLTSFDDRADYHEQQFARLAIESASERIALSESMVIDSVREIRLALEEAVEEGGDVDLRSLETPIIRIRYSVAFLREEVSAPVLSANALARVLEAIAEIPAGDAYLDRFGYGVFIHTLFGLYSFTGEILPVTGELVSSSDRRYWQDYAARVLSVWEDEYSAVDDAVRWQMLSLTRQGYIDEDSGGCGLSMTLSMMKTLTCGHPFGAYGAGFVLGELGLIDGGIGLPTFNILYVGENRSMAEHMVFDMWRSKAAGQLAASLAAGHAVGVDPDDPERWIAGHACSSDCEMCAGDPREVRYWSP